jgi:hypothetical protein
MTLKLLFCSSCNNFLSYFGYVVLIGRMIVNDELGRIWRKWLRPIVRHLSGGTEENHKKHHSG